MKKTLHITNGSSLTNYLRELDFDGEILTWQEMLCEGPTIAHIDSEKFFEIRKEFLLDTYNIEVNDSELKQELDKLQDTSKYSEIVLWFEYDLFCHINLIGVLSLIHQREINLPLYLVCSGRIEGEKYLKGLAELNPDQLLDHFEQKVRLNDDDKDLAISLWRTYCGKDHNLFKLYIVQNSSFKYLSNCLKAHLRRFPDSKSGLNILEKNILEIVRDKEIKSKHHLLGYILNYQGFYGYGDLQLERMIDNLEIFIESSEDKLTLSRKGHEALLKITNVASELNNDIVYGGIRRLEYQYILWEEQLLISIL